MAERLKTLHIVNRGTVDSPRYEQSETPILGSSGVNKFEAKGYVESIGERNHQVYFTDTPNGNILRSLLKIEAVGEISIPNGIHGEPSFKPHTNSKFKAVDKLNKAIYAQLERLNSSLPETNDIIENKVEPAIDTKSALVHALA
jgi:hypothetical protein|tara:strand:+ start:256 stop:687 length:432 start_codon:yes stop_codon:yes gene_type:complete